MTIPNIVSLKDKAIQNQFIKYGISGGISYIFIFSAMGLFVGILGVHPNIAFAIVYGFVYIVMYFVELKFVFREGKLSRGSVVKYSSNKIFFYFLGNLMYFTLVQLLGFNHMIALVINISLLFPLRFLSSKFFVYK